MHKKTSNPTRMCINCKKRDFQKNLLRFQCSDKNVVQYSHNNGRSFYLCPECIKADHKKLLKTLSRQCKREIKLTDLEKIVYG
ncbi:MAG: hypothetical protein B6D59_02320 [Campylobacteraceae bacterium 4484_4]|nr:MAG: hypothetical protein B6D59_02320 [Campylobacteraceae bacterium 4484_4]